MEVSRDMSSTDAVRHLRATVRVNVGHEVQCAIECKAPFAAIRTIFAGIDYVSALYFGWEGKGWIATKDKLVGFLRGMFTEATGVGGYAVFAEHLYEMFRNGTVHLYLPKSVHNAQASTPYLTWCVLTGDRDKGKAKFREMDFIASHLRPVAIGDTTILPIAPGAFWDDFLKVCELFATKLEEEENNGVCTLVDRWRKAANGLAMPTTNANLRW